jgi:hypothetical protein
LRRLRGQPRERRVVFGQLGERLRVRAPRRVAEVVVEVAQRLERLDALGSRVGQLDRAAR